MPFHPTKLSWRIGSKSRDGKKAMVLAYVDSRDVQERLDKAVGKGNWKNEYSFHGDRIICRISIKVNGEWVSKEDGAGDTKVESEKGGLSDAFKRAAVHWGINRSAYGLGNTWVNLTEKGYLPNDIQRQMTSKVPASYMEEYERYKSEIIEIKKQTKETK